MPIVIRLRTTGILFRDSLARSGKWSIIRGGPLTAYVWSKAKATAYSYTLTEAYLDNMKTNEA
jgi:hypothetical protein